MCVYFVIMSFIIGVCLGSFFNVCIYRIPNKKSVVNPPSHCYNCSTRLKPLDLIPILSWSLLRGKCRYCGQKISSRYALVELLTGILFVLLYNMYSSSIISLYYSLLVSLLVIITFIDLEHHIIHNELITFGLVGATIFNILGLGISLKESLLGGLVCAGGIFVLIYSISAITKKEVMGGGDIKLFFMVGIFLGTKLGLLTILLSFYAGSVYGVIIMIYKKIKKKAFNLVIPYGPFISMGAFISILYSTSIIGWYIELF